MDIGALIKFHRTKQNLSMNELAKRAVIAQSGLSDIEAGKRQPTFDLLVKIINALNLTWSEFLCEDTPEISPHIRELMKAAQSLPTHKIELLNKLAKALNETE